MIMKEEKYYAYVGKTEPDLNSSIKKLECPWVIFLRYENGEYYIFLECLYRPTWMLILTEELFPIFQAFGYLLFIQLYS